MFGFKRYIKRREKILRAPAVELIKDEEYKLVCGPSKRAKRIYIGVLIFLSIFIVAGIAMPILGAFGLVKEESTGQPMPFRECLAMGFGFIGVATIIVTVILSKLRSALWLTVDKSVGYMFYQDKRSGKRESVAFADIGELKVDMLRDDWNRFTGWYLTFIKVDGDEFLAIDCPVRPTRSEEPPVLLRRIAELMDKELIMRE